MFVGHAYIGLPIFIPDFLRMAPLNLARCKKTNKIQMFGLIRMGEVRIDLNCRKHHFFKWTTKKPELVCFVVDKSIRIGQQNWHI